jgi:hypothetical protein
MSSQKPASKTATAKKPAVEAAAPTTAKGARPGDVNGRHTLGSRGVQPAVRLALPGDLAKRAVSEGGRDVRC